MTGRVPLRLRVALAFALTAGIALAGLGAFVYVRVQDTLRDQAEQSLVTEMEALDSLGDEQLRAAVRDQTGLTFAQVVAADGEVLVSSPQLDGALDAAADAVGGRPLERAVRLGDDDEAEPALLLGRRVGPRVLVVGRSLEPVEEALDGVLTQFLIGVPVALLVASVAGYAVAGAALRPVERMRTQAASISTLDTTTRLTLPGADDEVRRLGETLNEMLDRLEVAARREREFVAQAGHELRTPLALLRMELDLALAAPRSNEEMVSALRSASDEVERLIRLAEDLLSLAGPEDAVAPSEPVEVPAEALLTAVARRYATLAESAGRRIRVVVESSSTVKGDLGRLERALGNLVHNAILHGEGQVTLRARAREGWLELRVEDEGQGVARQAVTAPVEDPPGAGRAQSSGSRPDHGLGLTIVRMIAEEHGGALQVPWSSDGVAGTVTLRLPLHDQG